MRQMIFKMREVWGRIVKENMNVARREQSNCSVIELNQTQSNLIERLGSLGSEIERNRIKQIV